MSEQKLNFLQTYNKILIQFLLHQKTSIFDHFRLVKPGHQTLLKMVFSKHIEIGGVVFSEKANKPAAIVNVISLNRLVS